MKCKNPSAPISPKQQGFIASLQAERNLPVTDESSLTMGEASELIAALLEMPKPVQSLTALAAAIEQKPAPVAAPAKPAPETIAIVAPTFSDDELKAIKSMAFVVDAEIGEFSEDEQTILDKIDAYFTLKADTPLVAPPAAPAQVPTGHYALRDGAESPWQFYKVEHGKPGTKWDGFTFLSKQAGDDFYPVKGAAKDEVLHAVGVNPLNAAKAYGHELGVCGVCHKTLTDPESIAAGIGPVCAAKLGA